MREMSLISITLWITWWAMDIGSGFVQIFREVADFDLDVVVRNLKQSIIMREGGRAGRGEMLDPFSFSHSGKVEVTGDHELNRGARCFDQIK